jgi:hypothetical protein
MPTIINIIAADLMNYPRIESEGIGLVLLGERDGHVGIYHSSQSLQHFVYAVHRSFVLSLETHYCRKDRCLRFNTGTVQTMKKIAMKTGGGNSYISKSFTIVTIS